MTQKDQAKQEERGYKRKAQGMNFNHWSVQQLTEKTQDNTSDTTVQYSTMQYIDQVTEVIPASYQGSHCLSDYS